MRKDNGDIQRIKKDEEIDVMSLIVKDISK